MTKIRIRPYQAADFDAVTLLWFGSWQSMRLTRPKRDPLTAFRRRFREQLSRGWSLYVAATATGIVGLMSVDGDEIKQLFVASAMQGRGIGKELLNFAKSQRPNGFWLITPTKNDRGRHFYEREGLTLGKISRGHRPGYQVIRYDWLP